MVKLTDGAIGRFRDFLSESKNVSGGVRIFARGGG